MSVALVFSLVTLVIIGFVLIGAYNALVGLKNQVDRAWSNIDVILKQRFDEIPSLIEVIEQFAKYEKDIVGKLVAARQNYVGAKSNSDKMEASASMSQALNQVLAIGENYPELKSNNNFVQLQSRISALEESLSDRRELFNETVTNFNTRIAQIPYVFFAGALGYQEASLFRVQDAERAKPSLKMNLGQ